MDRKYVLFAGVALAAAGNACAQNIEWRQAVYAEVVRVDHGGAVEQVPFYPFSNVVELPQRVMQVSLQGTPGILLAGAAQIGEGTPPSSAPTTPYVTKLDAGDGHVLWAWQPQPDAPPEGRIRWLAIDASGAIFVAGTLQTAAGEQARSLLVKLDGMTGVELWRVTGDQSTTAYAVVLDAAGSVIITSSEPNDGQRVSKYAASDGTPGWSRVIAGGIGFFGDFRLAVASNGDFLAAGSCGGSCVQVARLRSDDGTEAWRYFTSDMTLLEEAQVLVAIDDDALIASRSGSVRLAGVDGSVVWHREEPLNEFRTFDVFVDSAGRLFSAGGDHIDATAAIRRYDPATGDMIWEAALTDGSPPPANAFLVAPANDGSLLSGWYSNPVGAGRVDAESGAVAWSRALDPIDMPSFPVGIAQAPDGSIFVSSYAANQDQTSTWVVFKLVETAADTIFVSGFDE